MRVAIIIPALNEAALIGSSVERARAAGADEVVVIDGGSRDGTPDIARGAGCDVRVTEPSRARQQNLGARIIGGDVLLFLHADNWLAAGAVDQIRQCLGRPDRQAGAFRQRIEAPGWAYRLLERGNALRVRLLSLPYGDQGIFVRRQTFLELGGFPAVPLMEDLLLMRTLRRVTRPVLLPGPLHVSARRWQRHGVVRQTMHNWWTVTAYSLGVPLERLARAYRRHDL
jgi:rSAM/selenodomain-associated transferase 2